MNLRVLERGTHGTKDETKSITEWKRILSDKGLLYPTGDPNVYKLRDPQGRTHQFNLMPWSGSDPDKTFISIAFQWRDPAKVGTKYQR